MEIDTNKVVKMHYKGTLSDGTQFDSSEGREPLEFIYGNGMIISGLEEELKGLKANDKKTIKVPADKAYGQKQDEALQEVPKENLPQDVELKVGMQLAAQGPQGTVPVTVAEVKDNAAVIDFNHPLAGKDLSFDVEIVDVRDATKEELEHGHTHGPNDEHKEE